MAEEELFQTNELSRPASSRLVYKGQQQVERGELQAAAKTLQRAVEADPALANVFMRLRREPEAHAMATLALSRRPGDRQALEVLEATREGE